MIGQIVELISNLIQVIILTMFYSNMFGYKYPGNKKNIGIVAICIIVFLEISFINHIVIYDGFLTGILIITYTIYAHIFLKGKSYAHIFTIIATIGFIFTLASTVIFIFSFFTDIKTVNLIADFTFYRFCILIICRTIEFIIFKTIVHINREYVLSKKEWTLFIAIALMTWFTITFMTDAALKAHEILPNMFYCIVTILCINFLIYYLLIKINNDAKTKLEFELIKMQYNNIKTTEENMKALYENTYSVKHDLEKHFLALKTMAESNNNKNIINYIDHLYNVQLNAVQKIVFTDNDIFNAIINTKLEICKQKNIVSVINVSNEAISYIKSEDIAVLFGNIFDNAIEASQNTLDRIITLSIQIQGEYISIFMENSFNNSFSNINLTTTKQNKYEHGFGLKNVQRIVEKYDGMIQYFNSNEMFSCDILLKRVAMPNSTKNTPNST